MIVDIGGPIERRVNLVNYAVNYGHPIVWRQDEYFSCEYGDVFDNILVECKPQKHGVWLNPSSLCLDFSQLLFKPYLLCRAEENVYSLGLKDCLGVELNSIGVPDDEGPLYVGVKSRQEVMGAQQKWGSRVHYYKRGVWGTHRKEGIYEAVISLLLLGMCGQINTSTYGGLLAKKMSETLYG